MSGNWQPETSAVNFLNDRVTGERAAMLDALKPFDVLSFTGSADTAAQIRSDPAILGEDAAPGTPAFGFYVKEIAREMTSGSGQRCTAIQRNRKGLLSRRVTGTP